MPCNQQCNQGRDCDCGSSKSNRSTVIVTTLLFLAIISMAYGVYTLLHGIKGQECQIDVHFKDSTATYIGRTV